MKNRPAYLDGVTYNIQSGCCKLYITINFLDKSIEEVFISTTSTQCQSVINGIARIVSLCLEHDTPIEEINNTLSKIRCPQCVTNKDSEFKSCPDAIGALLMELNNAIQ